MIDPRCTKKTEIFLSGRAIDLLNPKAGQIHLRDIATSLTVLQRFGGQTSQPWDVAIHSVLVCDLVRRRTDSKVAAVQALLHDAAEAYIGDIIAPVKAAMRALSTAVVTPLDDLEEMWRKTIFERFDVPLEMHPAVKDADIDAFMMENSMFRGARFDGESNPAWNTPTAVFAGVRAQQKLIGSAAAFILSAAELDIR